jgi:hypothetical protein
VHGQVSNAVLQKVGIMLTDNIYDVIPGYAQITDTVHVHSEKHKAIKEN